MDIRLFWAQLVEIANHVLLRMDVSVCVMTYLSVEYGTFVSRQLKISNMAMARNV